MVYVVKILRVLFKNTVNYIESTRQIIVCLLIHDLRRTGRNTLEIIHITNNFKIHRFCHLQSV